MSSNRRRRATRSGSKNDPEPLIFLHIPRTGGTTLTRIGRRQFSPDQIYMIDSRDPSGSAAALRELPAFGHDRLRLIAGHASFGTHRYVGGGRYFTLIREPVERVKSHYRYAQQHSEHPMHEAARAMTLGEMLEADMWRDLSNGQCRALADEWDFPCQVQPTLVLENAKANLTSHFAFWGLTERFAETLLMAKATVGWRRLAHAPENGTQRTMESSRTGAERELVMSYNDLDIALYTELAGLFEERLVQLVPDWQRQLRRLRTQSIMDEPRRRLRLVYERARLRAYAGQRADRAAPTLDANESAQSTQCPASYTGEGRAAWLRRWVVGGYDWQMEQKEWIRRRVVGDYGWGRIADSFEFMDRILEPCQTLKTDRAYDVGCGSGLVSFALASHFKEVLAADSAIRPLMRARALARSSRIDRIRFLRANAYRFEPAEPFDFVLCNLMSHNRAGRLHLLQRLAAATDNGGWIVYGEEAEGYAPRELETAVAERDLRTLRVRLRQVIAGVNGDPGFRFFVAPTADSALRALGFEVVREETSWWRSLHASHWIWCRKIGPPTLCPVDEHTDYVDTPAALLSVRQRARPILGYEANESADKASDVASNAVAENQLTPLLVLIEMTQYALPSLPLGVERHLPGRALRAIDSVRDRSLDWPRIEDMFSRFVASVDRFTAPADSRRDRE